MQWTVKHFSACVLCDCFSLSAPWARRDDERNVNFIGCARRNLMNFDFHGDTMMVRWQDIRIQLLHVTLEKVCNKGEMHYDYRQRKLRALSAYFSSIVSQRRGRNRFYYVNVCLRNFIKYIFCFRHQHSYRESFLRSCLNYIKNITERLIKLNSCFALIILSPRWTQSWAKAAER